MMKKCAIANRMAVIVDQMWASRELSTGINVWVAAVLFLLQLYADFSGCMDIVLGVSTCFGVHLPENFRAPFYSRSVQEFWRRWHITLGAWLRDYIMNPILRTRAFQSLTKRCRARFGKREGKKIPAYLAMLAVWLCMGLWHGDSWKYIIGEGLWFWLIIVSGQVCAPAFKAATAALRIRTDGAAWRIFQTARTFFLCVVGNIFFRADTLADALARIGAGFRIRFNFQFLYDLKEHVEFSQMGGKKGLAIMGISLIAVWIVDFFRYREVDVSGRIASLNWKWRWLLYYAIVIVIYLSLSIASQASIYAQF